MKLPAKTLFCFQGNGGWLDYWLWNTGLETEEGNLEKSLLLFVSHRVILLSCVVSYWNKTLVYIASLSKWLRMKILLLQFWDGEKSLSNLYAQCSYNRHLKFILPRSCIALLISSAVRKRRNIFQLTLECREFHGSTDGFTNINFFIASYLTFRAQTFPKLDCVYCSVIEIPTSR